MNVLFLDDNPHRHRRFRGLSLLAKHVTTADQCIEALQKESWDIVFLDHDLEGEAYDDPRKENSGSAVVRWVVEHRPEIKRFIVHSYNKPQAHSMVEALTGAGYTASWEPFNPPGWAHSEILRPTP